ncbi:MAG: hypothetical protein NTY08_16310, partial [Proteobacteria bacterium]|nr:hypothetical protein [Pseudomonadota bacterium]
LTKSQVALLTKRDPVRKAERAAAKHGPKGNDVGSRTNTVENAVESDDAAVPPPAGDQTIAAARQRQNTAGRYKPAAVRHQVCLRDQRQCNHVPPDGSLLTGKV